MLAECITLFVLLGVFVFTILLLHRYPHHNTHASVYVFVFLGWFCSFVIITLVPYDVYLGKSHSSGSLKPAWFILYWSIFVVCWVIMPVMNSFYRSGEFSQAKKLQDAIKTELKFILVISVAFAGFVVYLLVINQMTLSNIPEIFVLLSNLWGLLLLIVLLGHGLVSVPMSLWQKGSLLGSLQTIQIQATNLEYKRIQVQEDLQKCRTQVLSIQSEGTDEEFKRNLMILKNECGINDESEASCDLAEVKYAELVRLHKKVKNLRFEESRNEW